MSIAAEPVVAFTRRRVVILAGMFVAGLLVVALPSIVLLAIATFDGRSTETDFIHIAIYAGIALGALAVAFTCTGLSSTIGRRFSQANPSARSRYKLIRGAVTGGKSTRVPDEDAELAVAYARYMTELLPVSVLQFLAFYVAIGSVAFDELMFGASGSVLVIATEVLLGFAIVAAVLSVTFTLRGLGNARRFLARPSAQLGAA